MNSYDLMSYREYLSTEYWYDLSRRIIDQRGHRCELCELTEDELRKYGDSIEVHHVNRTYKRGNEVDGDLKVLCGRCHRKIHSEDTRVFPEGKYSFKVTEVEERLSRSGLNSVVVSLMVYVGEKTFRVAEWFNDQTSFKIIPFFNSVGIRLEKNDDAITIEDFRRAIDTTGRAEFIIREHDGRSYNNVNKWFYKPAT